MAEADDGGDVATLPAAPRFVVNAETVADYNDESLSRLGPGAAFEVFRRCERVIGQLKLLSYEREFLPMNPAFKLFSRHYFARASNTGEQFFLFTSLAVWLARRAQLTDVEMPHEFDDPNAVVGNILETMKTAGCDIAFSPNKLKSGSGPYCVFVLQRLAKAALEQRNFRGSKVEIVAKDEETDDGDDAAAVDDSGDEDDIEMTADQFNDEEYDVVAAADEDENMNSTVNALPPVDGQWAKAEPALKSIMNTFTDPNAMTSELRRVIPQLRITIRSELKDWKMHIEQMDKYEKEIEANFNQSVRPYLAQNAREIGDAVERITSRETHINAQFDHLMHTFRLRQNELADVSEKYRKGSGTLNSHTETLETLNEEVEQVKQQIEEQGVRNTNGTPILKIKQALAKMENSIFTMRVQIVVAEQRLIQSQLADRLHLMTGGVRDPFA